MSWEKEDGDVVGMGWGGVDVQMSKIEVLCRRSVSYYFPLSGFHPRSRGGGLH